MAHIDRQITALDVAKLIAGDKVLALAEVLTSVPGIGSVTKMPELGTIDGKAAAIIHGGRARPRRLYGVGQRDPPQPGLLP